MGSTGSTPRLTASGVAAFRDELATLSQAATLVTPSSARRAASLCVALVALGRPAPLCVVHDLAVALLEPSALDRGVGDARGKSGRATESAGAARLTADERDDLAVLEGLSTTALARDQGAWRRREGLVVAVLSHLLDVVLPTLAPEHRAPPLWAGAITRDEVAVALAHRAGLGTASSGALARLRAGRRALVGRRVALWLAAERLDTGVLSLAVATTLQPTETEHGVDVVRVVEALALLGDSSVRDTVQFSLELLPSELRHGVVAGHTRGATEGISGITRAGAFSDLLVSQLAEPDELFELKFASDGLHYYAHERLEPERSRDVTVLVDGSASMRGVREVVARGVAIVLCRQLDAQGQVVRLRMFDSVAHPPWSPIDEGMVGLARVLQFRARRARHYAGVLRDLIEELSARRAHGEALPRLFLITHAHARLPDELVARLCALTSVIAVLVAPEGEALPAFAGRFAHVHRVDLSTAAAAQLGSARSALRALRRHQQEAR